MKATLKPEATIYTLHAGAHTFTGYKQVGELSGLKHLVNQAGHEALVMVGGGMASSFRQLFGAGDEVIIIASNGPIADLIAVTEKGIRAVVQERERQITEKGWTPAHDDEHDKGELASAAICYTIASTLTPGELAEMINSGWSHTPADIKRTWPWDTEYWKPGTPQRMLEKAAALLIAERERIDRLKARDAGEPREA